MKKILIFSVCFFFGAVFKAEPGGLRIIYIIHADGNYLFHDEDGEALNAAEKILSQSLFVGENIKRGEVFIFYQKPAENFLLLFPKNNGEFYYFKNGLKILEETYTRDDKPELEAESLLLKKNIDSSSDDFKSALLYYGHEIPLNDSAGYNQSQPEKKFGLNIFKEGIKKIFSSIPSQKKFNMIVLSTCKNGNAKTARELYQFADYLIGSPADIHLSYLNSESLIKLSREKDLSEGEMAEGFAENAFKIMSETVSTEVSISIFDLNISKDKTKAGSKDRIMNLYRASMFGRKVIP